MHTHRMLIDGRLVDAPSKIEVVDPANGKVIGSVPDADRDSIRNALDSAGKGFKIWSATTPAERKRIILDYANLLDDNRDRIIEILIAETGKPRENAAYDFAMLPNCLRFFVEEFQRLDQPVIHDPENRFLHYVQRQPLGVVVGILAWNFPLLNIGYKLGPVLASGCSAVIKPSQLTPLATLEACHLLKQAGIPDGVVNIVTCSDHAVVADLLTSDTTSMVTMIGSTGGGLKVMNTACTSVKHFSVELGGNAPVLVYPDADVARAAEHVVKLKFANSGQVCVSPNRCFVHESVYDEFMQQSEKLVKNLTIGPIISERDRSRILDLVRKSVAEGAVVICGGQAQPGPGYYMEPTVLGDVTTEMSIASEEIFGPVLPVIKFNDSDDEIGLANSVKYGLAAYVFTSDISTGLKAARDIEAGSVCVNEPHYAVQLPHGGIKQSGLGKDCSKYSLEEYLTIKRISVLIEN